MFNIGPSELLMILVLALVVVGPQRLPELSRQIGRGLREFRKVQDEVKDMVKFDLSEDTPTPRRSGPPTPRPHRSVRPVTGGPNGSVGSDTPPAPESASENAMGDAPESAPENAMGDAPETSLDAPADNAPGRASEAGPADAPPASPTPSEVPASAPTPGDVPATSRSGVPVTEPPATSAG
jgi:sec-independent protein translocase protein TatB